MWCRLWGDSGGGIHGDESVEGMIRLCCKITNLLHWKKLILWRWEIEDCQFCQSVTNVHSFQMLCCLILYIYAYGNFFVLLLEGCVILLIHQKLLSYMSWPVKWMLYVVTAFCNISNVPKNGYNNVMFIMSWAWNKDNIQIPKGFKPVTFQTLSKSSTH